MITIDSALHEVLLILIDHSVEEGAEIPELLMPGDLLRLPEFFDLLKHDERLDDNDEHLEHFGQLILLMKILHACSLAEEV